LVNILVSEDVACRSIEEFLANRAQFGEYFHVSSMEFLLLKILISILTPLVRDLRITHDHSYYRISRQRFQQPLVKMMSEPCRTRKIIYIGTLFWIKE